MWMCVCICALTSILFHGSPHDYQLNYQYINTFMWTTWAEMSPVLWPNTLILNTSSFQVLTKFINNHAQSLGNTPKAYSGDITVWVNVVDWNSCYFCWPRATFGTTVTHLISDGVKGTRIQENIWFKMDNIVHLIWYAFFHLNICKKSDHRNFMHTDITPSLNHIVNHINTSRNVNFNIGPHHVPAFRKLSWHFHKKLKKQHTGI